MSREPDNREVTDAEEYAQGRLADAIEIAVKRIGPRVVYNGSDRFSKLIDGILVLAVCSLVGVVWHLSIQSAEMRRDMDGMRRELSDVARAVKPVYREYPND